MNSMKIALVIGLVALLWTPTVALSDDVDDLKTALTQVTDALAKKDLEALSSLLYDNIVFFGLDAPFPVVGKNAFRQVVQGLFSTNEVVKETDLNPQFRVIGNTGFVWGHSMFTGKPKDGPLQTTFARMTIAWVKADGKWLVGLVHFSRIPSGD